MNSRPQWPLALYYDGSCPLCAQEIRLLRRHADPQRLILIDISLADFHAESLGLNQQALENLLHARFADGQWLTGLDATLWSWRAAGLGFWATPLTWPALRPLLNRAYHLFCWLRPHLSWLPHPDASRRCKTAQCSSEKPH